MRELIVSYHAIRRGQKRIFRLDELSEKGVERWYMENVPFAEKISRESRLYFKLEKTYNKKGEQKIIYLKDNFGIYIIEEISKFRGFLHSVQELNFRGNLRVRLVEFINKENIVDLINFRNALRRSQQTSEEIEDIIA